MVDTEGFVLRAEAHSAKVIEQDGIEMLLRQADTPFARLKHLWVGAGYGVKMGARTGRRRSSDGAWSSCSAHASPPRRACLWHGPRSGHTRAWWSIGRSRCHLKGS